MTIDVLATVTFPGNARSTVHLTTDGGWTLVGEAGPGVAPFERLLGRIADPARYGPADGDPVARAAEAAADLLSGTVAYVRTPEIVPADAVN